MFAVMLTNFLAALILAPFAVGLAVFYLTGLRYLLLMGLALWRDARRVTSRARSFFA